jgi:hypothetical protein
MKAATLATAIQRDLLRTKPAKTETPTCFSCCRPMLHRPSEGDDSSRFCSPRCREAHYVAGLPAYEVIAEEFRRLSQLPFTANSNLRVVAGPPGMTSYNPLQGSKKLSRDIKRRGSTGWVIECFGCGKEFDSKGLRCCSAECERAYREHCENEQLMAEAGMDKPLKRRCAQCGGNIPTWRNGRKVQERIRFCSQRCQRRHAKAPKSPDQLSGSPNDGL